MKRRTFLAGLFGPVLRSSIARAAEPSKIRRVGVLSPAEDEATPIFQAFRRGLHDLGYIESRDLAFEYRFARGDNTVLRRLAEELASMPVDVILADGSASAQAAAGATRT